MDIVWFISKYGIWFIIFNFSMFVIGVGCGKFKVCKFMYWRVLFIGCLIMGYIYIK